MMAAITTMVIITIQILLSLKFFTGNMCCSKLLHMSVKIRRRKLLFNRFVEFEVLLFDRNLWQDTFRLFRLFLIRLCFLDCATSGAPAASVSLSILATDLKYTILFYGHNSSHQKNLHGNCFSESI